MARPTKWRQIERIPTVQGFVPSNQGTTEFDENILKLEEIEAIRLKDLESLGQEECAEKMKISRPTFQRILLSARGKIADSLINGKAIRIEGGCFTLNICPIRCLDCGHEWTESFENMERMGPAVPVCPKCGSLNILCGRGKRGKFCRGHCRRHGRNEG